MLPRLSRGVENLCIYFFVVVSSPQSLNTKTLGIAAGQHIIIFSNYELLFCTDIGRKQKTLTAKKQIKDI